MFKKHFRVYEHLHIPFWLVKDTCWAMQFKTLGVAMIFPTLILALMISWKTRRNTSEVLPNIAITLWIIANSMWMCDEFFELDIKKYCVLPFSLGILLVGYWLIFYFPKIWKNNGLF